FDAKVPGHVAVPPVDTPEGRVFQVDIGADATIRCVVWKESRDLAGEATVGALRSLAADRHGAGDTLSEPRATHIEAGEVGGAAFLGVDFAYHAHASSVDRDGLLKTLVASKRGRTIGCRHDAVGYHETFRRFFDALIGSIALPAGVDPAPYYGEIGV